MILQVKLELNEDQLKILSRRAVGYLCENPRVTWKKEEYKEAARLAVKQLVGKVFDDQCLVPIEVEKSR